MALPKRFQSIVDMISRLTPKAFAALFWIIFYNIFQEKTYEGVLDELKQIFTTSYRLFNICFKGFETIQKQAVIDKNLQMVPFILAHSYINIFYDLFPSSRLLFSRQFGLKVFRLCIYELQGITVSTTYIELFIWKNFKDDLLSYIDMASDNKQTDSFLTNEGN